MSNFISERLNYEILMEYINNADNLKIIMSNIIINSVYIQLESFNIFKLFIMNPEKNPSILSILIQNKNKLLSFLESFLVSNGNLTMIINRR